MTNVGSHIARTSLVYYATVMMLSLRGIILIPLLLHTFGPETYGLYILALSGVSYGVVVAQFGLDSSIYQYLTPVLKTDAARDVFWTALQTAAAVAFIGMLVAAIVGLGGVGGDLGILILACALASSGQVLWGLSLTPYRCEERSGVYMTTSMSTTLGDFLLTATVAFLFRNLAIVFCVLATYHLSVASVLLVLQHRRLPFKCWSVSQFVKLVRFGFDGLVNQLFITGYFVWDRTIVSIAAGLSAVAAYAPGMAMGAVVLPLAGTSTFTLPTLLARPSIHRSPSAKRAVLRQAIRQYSLMALPAAVGAALISGPFLQIITTPALAAVATPISWVACAAVLASGLARFAILSLRADGDDGWLSKNLVAHFAVFVLLAGGASWFWPAHAPLVVAISILLVNLSQTVSVFIRLRCFVTNVLAPSLFITPMIGAAVFSVVFAFFYPRGIPAILLMVAVSVVLYAVVCMALERVLPRDLLAMIRKQADLNFTEAVESVSAKDPVLLYSGPNHLFASSGIFYAVELADAFEVHVILNEYGSQAITQAMLDALARRQIQVHWLPDRRGLHKHEAYRDFCDNLLERVPTKIVLVDDDMGPFNIVLVRRARHLGARVVCFQTGTFDRSNASDFRTIVAVQARLLADRFHLPFWLASIWIIARTHLRHVWGYYWGPVLSGFRPYPGPSSVYLRRSHTGRRGGERFLCYEPGAYAIAVQDGTPEEQMVAIGHPLLRETGRRLFAEIYPSPDYVAENAALLLVDIPIVAQTKQAEECDSASLAGRVAAVADALSRRYGQVLIKPHPVLQGHSAFLSTLQHSLADNKAIQMLEPSVNALGFLQVVRAVVGEQSTVLKLARYFPNLLVISAGFSVLPRRPFHASEAGLLVFDHWREIIEADISATPPIARASLAPEGVAPSLTVVDILHQCGMLPAEKVANMSAPLRAIIEK